MQTVLFISTQAILVVLLAEFTAGVVHWFEDAYIREGTPLIGNLIGRPNVIHHHLPRHMTRNNWWQSSWDLLLASVGVVMVAWALDCLTWHVWLFALISTNANEIHKWAHRTRRENGRIITFLQDIRLLQTSQHHALHHTNPKNVRYCVVTNALNPLLDRARFWELLEWLLARTIGLHRQPDTSLPEHGPAPTWLNELRRPGTPGFTSSYEGSSASLGHTALLILLVASGTGCRATKHVMHLSQPHAKLESHLAERIDAASVTSEGRIHLRLVGRLAGKATPTPLLLTLPMVPPQASVQRINIPADAVRVEVNPVSPAGSKAVPMPVGPPLIFKDNDTYEWDRLHPLTGHQQEVRLVRRLGKVERWEILLLDTDQTAGGCRFTVYEVAPASLAVSYPMATALVPLAIAADIVAVGTMVAGPVALVGVTLLSGRVDGLMLVDELEPVKMLADR